MNAATELLAELARRGIELQPHGDRLGYRPRAAVTPDLEDQLKVHKIELLVLLDRGSAPQVAQNAQNCSRTDARAPAGRLSRPDAPHELSLAERIAIGYVNPGSTPKAWTARLRQLADRCETLRPELAAQYRAWAKNVVASVDE